MRASNQFALPVLSYLMWTQTGPIAEQRRIDREARTIILDNGDKHPLGSAALLYLQREQVGRGLQMVEGVYKATKMKAAITCTQTTTQLWMLQDGSKKALQEVDTSKYVCR